MGLDTTHDCWHGAYSSFNRWRAKLAEVAGYGNLYDYPGFGKEPKRVWPEPSTDPLIILLNHSDCDGLIEHKHCLAVAERLNDLLFAMRIADRVSGYPLPFYGDATQRFFDGLLSAVEAKEDVLFQ